MRDEFDFLFEPLDAGRFACLTAGKGMRLKGNVTMPLITNQIARRLKVGGAFCFDSKQHASKVEVVGDQKNEK